MYAQNPGQKQDVYNGEHYRVMHSCFSLFVVLCMPDPGMERSMVGEQLMEWLNMNFVDPSSEEGDKLSALDKPWEDENFWPYITRTTLRGLQTATEFFLESLMRHPSKHVQMSATRLIPLIKDQPRAHQASTEKEFKVARRKWSDRVKLARIEFDRVPEAERDDGFENWWNWMSSILGVLEGREEVLIRVCNEIGAEWKDIVAAWTIFKEPDATRMDLP
jgi:nuclear pore complex protein Nup85